MNQQSNAYGIRKRGEDHKNSVLTSDKVREIARLHYDLGISQRALAREYGVSRSTIKAIVRGWTWGHVTGIEGKREQKGRYKRRVVVVSH